MISIQHLLVIYGYFPILKHSEVSLLPCQNQSSNSGCEIELRGFSPLWGLSYKKVTCSQYARSPESAFRGWNCTQAPAPYSFPSWQLKASAQTAVAGHTPKDNLEERKLERAKHMERLSPGSLWASVPWVLTMKALFGSWIYL